MQLLPVTADYDQTFKTTLNGVNYVFDVRWNERAQMWTFDLTDDASGTLLLAGAPFLIGVDVLSPYALGIGGLMVTDLSGSNSDAGPDDFADRVVVLYFTPDELAILYAAGVPGIVSPGPAQAPQGATPAASGVPGPSSSNPGGSPSGGGGGGGGGGGSIITAVSLVGAGFSLDLEQDDASGNEILLRQFPINASANPNPNLKAFLTAAAVGLGTIRIYVSTAPGTIGASGTPPGTLVATQVVSGAGTFGIIGTALSNPGGSVYVIITMQAASGTFGVGPFTGGCG